MKREKVTDINKCSTLADVGEYLEDNPFRKMIIPDINNPRLDRIGPISDIGKVLKLACGEFNHNFTQYQLKLQALRADSRAYEVLLCIMEIRLDLEKMDWWI